MINLTEKNFESFGRNKQVNILAATVFNIMSNFIPNKTILIDDRDSPWIDKKMKGLIHEKNLVHKKHLKKNNSDIQELFRKFRITFC